jgi:hypothetical protein
VAFEPTSEQVVVEMVVTVVVLTWIEVVVVPETVLVTVVSKDE